MRSGNVWDASLYDRHIGFVAKFGKDVVEWLQPKKGENILDLGCGTGSLSQEIAKSGAIVDGLDFSETMITKARQKYPRIHFFIDNGETFRTSKKYDAVFSNAALHWMKNAEKAAKSVWYALKPRGRFVAELGGKGNVQAVIDGIADVLSSDYGLDTAGRNPWYFPSAGEYAGLLERQGFTVELVSCFDRPTPLSDGEKGLDHWLDSFADDFFPEFSKREKAVLYAKINQKLRPRLYRDGIWVADYKRLRIAAVKNG